jgi:hypothetical protein
MQHALLFLRISEVNGSFNVLVVAARCWDADGYWTGTIPFAAFHGCMA